MINENKLYEEYKKLFIKEIEKKELLIEYYLKNKSQRDISSELGISKSEISRRIIKQRDAIRIRFIEQGYRTELILPKKIITNECREMERKINDRGLLYLVYNLDTSISKIANDLNMSDSGVELAIDTLIEDKKNILKSKDIKNVDGCINFIRYFFPNELYNIEEKNNNFFIRINKMIDSNMLFIKMFKENKNKSTIAKEMKISTIDVEHKLEGLKEEVLKAYKEYKNNENVTKLKINVDMKTVLKKKARLLEKRGLCEPIKYIRFTYYYFPDMLGEIEKFNDSYFKFIDEYINRNEIYIKFFKEGKNQSQIAQEINRCKQYVSRKLLESKDFIKKRGIVNIRL